MYVIVTLPVPVGHVGVRSCWRGVRHSHVGHHACPFAGQLRPLHARHRLVGGIVAGQTIAVAYVAGYADGLDVTFHARQVRRGRARRVGHLTVHTISLWMQNTRIKRYQIKFNYRNKTERKWTVDVISWIGISWILLYAKTATMRWIEPTSCCIYFLFNK